MTTKEEKLVERFTRYIEPDTNGGCWLWSGTINVKGYGRFQSQGGRRAATHRFAYETYRGPIPSGHQIDHLCGVRCCCNPAHLEAVTSAENNRRSSSPSAINARRTECIHGHAFTPENTFWTKRGKRACKECRRRDWAAYRAAQPKKPPKGNHHARKTHCPQGHPYAGHNLLMTSTDGRTCRECRRVQSINKRARKKARISQ